MGQAKQNKQIGDRLSQDYLDKILLDAMEQQNLVDVPDLPEQKFEILKKHFNSNFLPDLNAIRGLESYTIAQSNSNRDRKHRELNIKYDKIEDLTKSEQKKFIISELMKAIRTPEFQSGLMDRIEFVYCETYKTRQRPFLVYNKTADNSMVLDDKQYLGFDIINRTQKILNHQFFQSNSNDPETQEFIRYYHILEELSLLYGEEGANQFLACFRREFLLDNDVEFGEFLFLYAKEMYYSLSIIKTINERGVASQLLEKALYWQEYSLEEDWSDRRKAFKYWGGFKGTHHYNSVFGFRPPIKNIAINLENLLCSFVNLHSKVEDVSISYNTQIENNKITLKSFNTCSFAELIAARSSLTNAKYDKEYSGGYNIKLAQGLDQLIQDRYEQMADRGRVLSKLNGNKEPNQILNLLSNEYSIDL